MLVEVELVQWLVVQKFFLIFLIPFSQTELSYRLGKIRMIYFFLKFTQNELSSRLGKVR